MAEKLYTITELAELFGITRQGIHKWVQNGRFPHSFQAGNMTLIPASDVESVKEQEAARLAEQLDRLGFRGQVPA